MANKDLIKKLMTIKANPEMGITLNDREFADTVLVVLGAIENIQKAIQEGRLDGKTPEADKDYMSKETAQRLLLSEVDKVLSSKKTEFGALTANLSKEVQDAVARLQERIDSVQDGIVTEREILRAAEIARSLIELPDFESMVRDEVTSNGESIRNALELLQGDERLSVEAISGLEERWEEFKRQITVGNGGGGTSKPAVYRFIRDAIADGIISADLNITYSATEPSNPEDGDLWVDTSTQRPLPVESSDIRTIVSLTQAEYDALGSYDSETLYYITT